MAEKTAPNIAHAGPAPAYSLQSVHLIRTAQVNTLALSQMADQKAQILMGASFVVFSLVITEVGARTISWSMLCLAATAFLSSICAVIAILPRPGPSAIDRSSYNHLFFGHFALLDEASGPRTCWPSCSQTSGCTG